MKHRRTRRILAAILPLTLVLAACATGMRDAMDIRTDGFISDSCYQAILEIEPDDGASGLVAGRENSYLKGKNADLRAMAVHSMVRYCVEARSGTGIPGKDRPAPADAAALAAKINGLAGGGKIAFVYYNEKNSMIIGYRIVKIGLKKKLESIINPPDERTAADPTTPRS